MAEKLLSQKQAAAILGVDRSTLWRWVKEGRIKPDFTVNEEPLYTRSHIERLADGEPLRLRSKTMAA